MSEAISFSLHFLILFLPFFSFFLSLFFSSFNILKFLIAAKPQSFLIPHSTFHICNTLRAVA